MNESAPNPHAENQTAASGATTRRKTMGLLIGLIVVAVGAAVAIPLCLTGSSMNAGPLDGEKKIADAEPHTKLRVVAEVKQMGTSGGENTIDAQLLKKETEDTYLRTEEHVSILWHFPIKFVMGGASDLRPGAVVHVTGEKSNAAIDANQIVILTGYVKIK